MGAVGLVPVDVVALRFQAGPIFLLHEKLQFSALIVSVFSATGTLLYPSIWGLERKDMVRCYRFAPLRK